jgi:hypothetical protein
MKTSELTGAALDWAVTKCEGFDHEVTSSEWGMWGWATDWAQGGPIIEREFLELRPGSFVGSKEFPRIFAAWAQNQRGGKTISGTGPTQLIAAMRCYVASKLGDNIDIPKELT